MAYCDWCRLESDNEDSCVWCKRPIRRNYSTYGAASFDAIASLREEGAIMDRATPILGALFVVLFVGIIGYAVSHSASGPTAVTQASQVDPSNRIADSEKNWSGARLASMAPPEPAPRVQLTNAPRPSTTPNWTQPAPRASQTTSAPSTTTYLATRPVDENGMLNQGLMVESARLKPSLMSDGSCMISGTVNVRNIGSAKAEDFHFWLLVGDERIKLECASKQSLAVDTMTTFSLSARDLNSAIVNATNLRIRVEAQNYMGKMGDTLEIQ